MKKRILSTLLALCMALGMLPGTARAENAEAEIVPLATSDTQAPIVTGIYMNSPGGSVSLGDTLLFDIAVEDESEIVSASLGFIMEGAVDTINDRNTVFARLVSYDPEIKTAKVSLKITDAIPCTTWILNWISLEDYYGNARSEIIHDGQYGDVSFSVENTGTDRTAPTVQAINWTNESAIVSEGDTLLFDIAVEDESEIIDASLGFVMEDAVDTVNDRNTIFARLVSYDPEIKTAKVSLKITDAIPSTTWILNWISLKDYYGNAHSEIIRDGQYGDIFFSVENTGTDRTAPTAQAINLTNESAIVSEGDTLLFDIAIEDESKIIDASLGFVMEDAVDTINDRNTIFARFVYYDPEIKTAKASLKITDAIPSATWVLNWISIKDYYGNTYSETIQDGKYGEVKFVTANQEILPDSVSIPSTIEVRVRDVYTIRPTVTPATSIPKWTWASADNNIAEVHSAGGFTSCNVTGIAPGTTTITGTTQNGLTASCTVTVTDAPLPESGTVDELYTVGVGGFVDIAPVLDPEGATTLYEVTSDNPHVAGIGTTAGHTGIRIEGNNAGMATITIRGANNLVMTTTVKVGRDSDRQHEKTTVAGYAPTCTREGRTDAVRCSACWYTFTEAQAIPATGHSFGEWSVVRNATAATEGLRERMCASCGYREREVIPATGGTTGGNTPSGGNTTSGGNNFSGNTFFDGNNSFVGNNSGSTPAEIPSSSANQAGNVTANGQSIAAAINGGTAEVSAEQLSEILENSPAGDVIKIDVSAEQNVSEVSIPQNAVKAIHNSENISSLAITTNSGSIEMSGEALQTVSNVLTGGNDHIAIKVDTIDVNAIPATQKYPIANVLNSAVFVELSASVIHKDSAGNTVSTEAIHEFNGAVTVSVPYERPVNMEGRQIIACYIADDGAVTYFPVRYENGIATFTTTHFSMFAVIESRAAAFADVNIGAWYTLGVEYALQTGLMTGMTATRFAPDENLSRAQLAQILYNREGKPAVSGDRAFSDVPADAWYTDAVAWATANGIVGGYGDGRFGPDDNITREQLAVMLWRYTDEPASDAALPFNDAGQVSGYARTAVCWAVENGVLSGYGDGRLNPGGPATRAQAAQMLKGFLEKDS